MSATTVTTATGSGPVEWEPPHARQDEVSSGAGKGEVTAPSRSARSRLERLQEARAAWAPADGDEATPEKITSLTRRGDGRWRVHSGPGVPAGPVDYLLVGTPGVCAVMVLREAHGSGLVRRGTLVVDGERRADIRTAEHRAWQAGLALSGATGLDVDVTALLVLEGVRELVVEEAPSGVTVVSPRSLVPWLLGRPDVLSPLDVAMVDAAAARPSTWHGRRGC